MDFVKRVNGTFCIELGNDFYYLITPPLREGDKEHSFFIGNHKYGPINYAFRTDITGYTDEAIYNLAMSKADRLISTYKTEFMKRKSR